ncbi:PAS domain-containing protein [Thioclava sp. FR2]|uniref:PAS domain-containing protein n=1 Tax=Thioclava sp. FR2 TaxID=3445780 RepID=UPI003EC0CDA9
MAAMKLLSVRKLTNTAVFGIVAIQLVAMIDFKHQLQFLNLVTPLLPVISVLGLAILWTCARKLSKNEHLMHAKNLQLKQESLALNAHALVLLTDSNGTMTHVNDNFLERTGYTLEEVLGQQVDMLYFRDDLDLCQHLRATVYGGGSWQGETRIRCKKGAELWTRLTILPGYDQRGKPCGAISVRTDITEVKQMRIGQEVFRALNGLVDEVFIFDFETMQLKYANTAAAATHHLNQQKSYNADIRTIHPIYGSDKFLAAINELRESPRVRTHSRVIART